MRARTVAAVDAGFGDTKWAVSVGAVRSAGAFPSVPYTVHSDAPAWLFARGELLCVEVDGARFAVGRDVLALPGAARFERAFVGFTRTWHFQALVLAAIAEMDVPVIDTLALVVPHEDWAGECAQLQQRFTGELAVPARDGRFSGATKQVQVRELLLMPPALAACVMGLFQTAGTSKKPLVIDAGYLHTWCMTGAAQAAVADCGMARFFSDLETGVRQVYADRFPQAPALPPLSDMQLRQALLGAGYIDTPAGRLEVAGCDSVGTGRFKHIIGSALDDDQVCAGRAGSIVLIGGGAAVLAPVVRSLLPRLPVVPTAGPRFGTVSGALMAATDARLAQRLRLKLAGP